MSTDSTNINKSITSAWIGVAVSCLAFSIPLAIVYNFCYYKRAGVVANLILFVVVFLLGYIVTLMFYRAIVMNTLDAEINKIGSSTAKFVLGVTFSAFMIVAITMFAIGANGKLIEIFENTFGYWFIGIWGLEELANKIFTSKTMDPIRANVANSRDFNYNFLITRINPANLEEFKNYAQNCDKMGGSKLPLDFDLVFKTQDQIDKLEDLVYLKNTAGHFAWVYLSSVVALMISMISVTMTSPQ